MIMQNFFLKHACHSILFKKENKWIFDSPQKGESGKYPFTEMLKILKHFKILKHYDVHKLISMWAELSKIA